MLLGERLKKLREEKHLTIRALAEHLNIGRSTLSNYENGIRKPDYDTLRKFAEFYHVSVDYLIGRPNGPENAEIREAEANYETSAIRLLDVSDLPESEIAKIQEYIELVRLKYRSENGRTY